MLRKILGPGLSVILFAAAIWLLHSELKTHHLADILKAFESIPAARIWAAIGLTILSYAVMTGYDALALRYVRQPLAYHKIGLASFIGYAFSNNIGLSMIAGASVRYRLYSAWGLSALQITQVVAFCALTMWLGFFTLGGVTFLVEPMTIPSTLHLPFNSLRLIGTTLLAVVLGYGILTVIKRTPIRIREWEIRLPPAHLLFFQLIIAVVDWMLASFVLFVILAPGASISYPEFLAIYLLAQLAGLVSQVPGGLGVFETVIMLMLSYLLPADQIFGALLGYRAFYYWLPLVSAALLLGLQEILRKRERMGVFIRLFERWVSPMVPQVLAFTAFIGGAILLFSGTTPAVEQRIVFLKKLVPLPLLELSHFIGSIAGMGLLLLGRGLQRRFDAAYHLAVGLLIAGIIASMVKGLDYEEAIALLMILVAIWPTRRHFYRKSSLFSQRFNAGWIAAIFIVLGCSVWLGYYSYRHVEYADSLWWRFAFGADASRFLRATVGVVVCGLFFAAARLLKPAPPQPLQPGVQELEKTYPIVRNSVEVSANLALLGDKRLLFSPEGDAFIMYAPEGRSWIAMGDPVGPDLRWLELIWKFRELSDRYGGRPVFYEVGHEHLHLYLDLGLSLLKLGEEARVPLSTFSLEGSARKDLRYTKRKLEKEGCRFELLQPESVITHLDELKTISDAWLAEKNTREKGFSLGFFQPNYIRRCPVALVIRNERIEAFANLWAGTQREELSLDLMRYLPQAPHGVMEYLFICLMLWGKEQGYRWFNLGMAPFSGLENRALAPLWSRLGAFVFRYGEHFYNFQGVRQYKEKFDPKWRPRYLASPGGLALPQIFANLATLISGGIKGVVAK
ncbi:MAG: bifunctional lysylphosphatidylglycerol flippase/synthetase MprF [Deltaproteobacteria bacterium]|nr:bifunctional lysylphosphatidylglycerol flippase/synthetase MprF [Deltaproteobacteria bacterium]